MSERTKGTQSLIGFREATEDVKPFKPMGIQQLAKALRPLDGDTKGYRWLREVLNKAELREDRMVLGASVPDPRQPWGNDIGESSRNPLFDVDDFEAWAIAAGVIDTERGD